MRKLLIAAYGLAAYAIGMASLVYLIGWLGNFGVPRSIDSDPSTSLLTAVLINACLFVVFGIQHSVMARPGFKAWLTRFVPKSAERSTYVLCSAVALFLVMLLWQPMGIMIWNLEHPAARTFIYGLYALGWVILVGSTFVLNHFDLFGLRQVWLELRDQPYTHLPFATPGPYRLVRHPLYVGWITLVWATPSMSLAHLAFALATTAYILIAIRYEERNLVTFHGQAYADYRERTPMLLPVRFSDGSGRIDVAGL